MARLRDIMTADPIAIRDDAAASEAADLLDDSNVRHLPVLRGDTVVGILSSHDLARFRAIPDPALTVADLLTDEVIFLGPDAPVEQAIDLLVAYRINAVPVVDAGKLVGIVTTVDLLELLRSVLR